MENEKNASQRVREIAYRLWQEEGCPEGEAHRTMPPPVLPTYYYLDHFTEMLSFVRGTYGSILADEHHAFIARFEGLQKTRSAF